MKITAPKTVRVPLQNVPARNVEWGPEDWIEVVPLGWLTSLEIDQAPIEAESVAVWNRQRLKGGLIQGEDGTAYHLPEDWDRLPGFARWSLYNEVLMACWRGDEFARQPSEDELKKDDKPSKP